jgi:ParB-like chromosome segregation protein Spo0J
MPPAAVIPHEYVMLAVDSIEPHPANPRRGDVARIGESIRVNGFFGALVVQRSTMRILIGNHRWLAARDAGISSLPALLVDCDDAEASRILVADNKIGDDAYWDEDELIALLRGMTVDGGTLEGTGFSVDEFANLIGRHSGELPPGFETIDVPDGDEIEPVGATATCPACGETFPI